MPFTLSHPAAVIPLTRRGLPLSALVVGSMAPDFPYFISPSKMNDFGHSIEGIFLFCIPGGLFALWLFHNFLKMPLLSLLPPSHQQRLGPVARSFRWASWRDFWLIVLALAIGAVTHLVWDDFTHYYGFLYEEVGGLRDPIIELSYGRIFLYDLLQYLSTFLGMVAILVFYFLWFKKAVPEVSKKPLFISEGKRQGLVVFLVLFALACALFDSYLTMPVISSVKWLKYSSRNTGVMTIRFALIELLVYCAVWQWKMGNRYRRRRAY